jgi:protein-S-isoprenylcysteine O-methyltransferase Ste14
VWAVFSLRWWLILGYVVSTLLLLAFFDICIRRKTGEGLVGHRVIPHNRIVIFAVRIIATWIVILYPVLYLFDPNLVDVTLPISPIRSLSLEIPGVLLIIVGWLLTTISMLQLGLSARVYLPGQRTGLITSGVYNFCRNPAYVGVYSSFLGMFLLLPSLIYLVGFCLFFIHQHFKILQEERFLAGAFGTAYEEYRQRVGRYLRFVKE